MSVTAYIALGSNLQQPAEQVRAALTALAALPECSGLCASSLYVTAPVGYADQPDFINAVARLDASGNVRLDKAKSAEKIDGLAALVNALSEAIVNGPDDVQAFVFGGQP